MNRDIRGWGNDTTKDLKKEFARLNIEHVARSPSPRPSRDVLANQFQQRGGMINKVGFKFPRHMVFVHKGLGKGVGKNFSGITTRRPKEWFNPVMEKDVNKLADIVANAAGDIVVKNVKIR